MQQVAAQQKKVGDFTALFAVGGSHVLSFCKKSSVQKVYGKILENPICFLPESLDFNES